MGDLTAAKAAAESKQKHAVSEAEASVSTARAAQAEAEHARDSAAQCVRSLETEMQQLESSNKRLADLASRSQEELGSLAMQLTSERTAHEEELRTLEAARASADHAAECRLADELREAAANKQQLEDQLHCSNSEMEVLQSQVRCPNDAPARPEGLRLLGEHTPA